MIYISAVAGGPELRESPIQEALRRVARWNSPPQGPVGTSVTAVFEIPGSLVGVPFTGVRTANWSKKKRSLLVQVAVPAEEINSPEVEQFLITSLRECIRIAKPKFEKAAIEFPEEDYLALVDRMERELRH